MTTEEALRALKALLEKAEATPAGDSERQAAVTLITTLMGCVAQASSQKGFEPENFQESVDDISGDDLRVVAGKRLSKWMRERKIRTEDMAEKLGVSKSTVDRYRVGLIAPSKGGAVFNL